MENCLFCKIIKGEIPSFKVYEDEVAFAFLDIHPKADGHTLIIPKKHYRDLQDIDQDTLLHLIEIVKTKMKEYEEQLHCTGFTIAQNNGDVQEVKHFHLHLIPSYSEQESISSPEEIYQKLKK